MGGMAILFWQKEDRLLEEIYLNVSKRRSYLDALGKAGGFLDWDRALAWKCMNCMGARMKAEGFFEGNRKVWEWLTRNKGPDEIAYDTPVRIALDVAERFRKLEGKGFMWVIFKDSAVSCLHPSKCIYHPGICISCGKESTPYISIGIERQGWAPDLKNHRCYCIECCQGKMKIDKISFISTLGFYKEGKD